MSKINTLNKTEARAACKKAGISYSNLTVARMRAALSEKRYFPESPAETSVQSGVVMDDPAPAAPAEQAAPAVTTPPAADPAPAEAAAPAAAEKPAKPARPPREQQNGVKKPGPGKCLDVWNWMDEHKEATAADVRTWATAEGLNPNNAQIERSQWRKFHGFNKPTA